MHRNSQIHKFSVFSGIQKNKSKIKFQTPWYLWYAVETCWAWFRHFSGCKGEWMKDSLMQAPASYRERRTDTSLNCFREQDYVPGCYDVLMRDIQKSILFPNWDLLRKSSFCSSHIYLFIYFDKRNKRIFFSPNLSLKYFLTVLKSLGGWMFWKYCHALSPGSGVL